MRYLEKKGERVKWLVSLMGLAILMTITNCGGNSKKGGGNSNSGKELALEIENGKPKLVNKGKEAIDLGKYSFTAKVIEAKDHDGNNVPNLKAKLIKGGLSVPIEGTMTASTVAGDNSTFNPGQAIDFGMHPDSYEGVATARMECCLLKEGTEVSKQQVEWRSKFKITLAITGGDGGSDFDFRADVENVSSETISSASIKHTWEIYNEGGERKHRQDTPSSSTDIAPRGGITHTLTVKQEKNLKTDMGITNKFSVVFIIKDATGQVISVSKRQEGQLRP
ncbi:MAG: hypothetical protein ROO73_04600 [Roseivirga sp.]